MSFKAFARECPLHQDEGVRLELFLATTKSADLKTLLLRPLNHRPIASTEVSSHIRFGGF